ncbi:hypothetical protein WJX72_007427 [[Myrmecia] bisecta]|uniref:Uncharacterized protein n=1 Tax=[Myrmecia] bisecta TaxID=41462 RepID=A0AAW1P4V8_9CHLO
MAPGGAPEKSSGAGPSSSSQGQHSQGNQQQVVGVFDLSGSDMYAAVMVLALVVLGLMRAALSPCTC